MIKNIFNNTATLLLPALAAGIFGSCKNEARPSAAPKRDTIALKTATPIKQAEYKNDRFAEFTYTIPYLGIVDDEPVELQLTHTATDTLYGNYIWKYDDWGNMGYYLEGKVTNGSFVLRGEDNIDPKPTFNFKMNDEVLKGTLLLNGKKQDISLIPAISIAQNPQLDFKYRLVAGRPTQEDDFPVTDNNYKVLTQIKIYKGDELLQTLYFDRPAIANDRVLSFRDYNFDGYLDLAVEIRYPGAIKYGLSMLMYLYDKEKGIFVENRSLNYYGIVHMYYGREEIFNGDADGSNESNETLKWFNDTLLMVKRVYHIMDDPAEYHQEYSIENETSTLTKEYTE
jgi:hypothetical protein